MSIGICDEEMLKPWVHETVQDDSTAEEYSLRHVPKTRLAAAEIFASDELMRSRILISLSVPSNILGIRDR